MGRLRDEYGQASNIKSASTRKNVLTALEKIMHFLKGVPKPPDNGIAIFCGNVSREEGKPDVRIYSIVPAFPLRTQFYRCESQFVLEPLEEMLEAKGSHGLVVLDGKDATVAVLKGKSIRVLRRLHSTAHAKFRKGGQSAARFERIREEEIETYYKRIGEAMDAFLEEKDFKGVIVGGPGPAKEDFVKMRPFNYQIKVLGVVDTGYADEFGLRELMEKGEEIISEQEAVVEKKLVEEFTREAVRGGKAAYGYDEVRKALEAGRAERLLVSEGLVLKKIVLKCGACGKTVERVAREEKKAGGVEEPCECGGRMRKVGETDLVKELLETAERSGVGLEMVSTDTQAGKQFLAMFHGLGAFLRY